MSYTEEQFNKLPKWAQSEIRIYKNRIEHLEMQVNQLNGIEETNTFICSGLTSKPLPKDSIIDFKTGQQNMNTVSVYVMKNGSININADSRLGEDMVILPRASNSFYITFKK